MAGARKRHDPPSREADGRTQWDEIGNKDPGRHYVLTDPNDRMSGTQFYLRRGYEIEHRRADGPTVSGEYQPAKADGDEIRSGDLVLVSRPMSVHEAEQKRQSRPSEEIEKRILKEENVEDGFRGRSGVRFRSVDEVPDAPFPD